MYDITKLVQNVSSHTAVNNRFFELWLNNELSAKQLEIFARNYWEWAHRFPEAIALLIAISDDYMTRAEYTKTLHSEIGYGRADKIHSHLFENFYDQLIAKVTPSNIVTLCQLRNKKEVLPETTKLVNWEKETYFSDKLAAAGAQLAIEWQAYTMIRLLYEGARNYRYLWSNQDEFHEACEFFYVHIGEAEKQHKEESFNAAKQLVTTDAAYEKLSLGFERHLELIATFWEALAAKIET